MEVYKSIIIMGPIDVGKTTLAHKLGNKYGLDIISGDIYKRLYMAQMNMPLGMWQRIHEEKGIEIVYKIWEEFYAPMVVQLLRRVQNNNELTIVDLGGNQSTFYEQKNFDIVNEEMKKFKNTILMTPFEDKMESLSFLNTRSNNAEENRKILFCDSSERFAKKIIYTRTKDENTIFKEVDSYLNESLEMHKILSKKMRSRKQKEKKYCG